MKIALIADLHFGFDKNSDDFLKILVSYIKNDFVNYLNKNNIKEIFILGDLFENRINLNNKIFNEVYDLFNTILSNFKIHILLGNHDIYYNSTNEIHSLKFLSKFENVIVYDDIKSITLNNRKIQIIPWLIDQNNIKNVIRDSDIILGHFNINGFNYNKYIISKNGVSHETFLDKSKYIFSGHFHTRSVKNIKNTEIVYVGSPIQFNKNDIDEDKGFIVFDLENMTYKFVNNVSSPKFVNVDYPFIPEENVINNNKIDVYIKYKSEDFKPKEYEKYLEKIHSLNPFSLKHTFIKENYIPENIKLEHFNLSSIENVFKTYLNTLNFDENEKEIYYNKFVEIKEMVSV